jgi:hypothetical protein
MPLIISYSLSFFYLIAIIVLLIRAIVIKILYYKKGSLFWCLVFARAISDTVRGVHGHGSCYRRIPRDCPCVRRKRRGTSAFQTPTSPFTRVMFVLLVRNIALDMLERFGNPGIV